MVDITMCKGNECPIKEKCLRYTCLPGCVQSYFMEIPYKEGSCKFFMSNDKDDDKEDEK